MSKEFKVYERNTYSMAVMVDSTKPATMAQIAKVQKFVYDFDIIVRCCYYRADMCDLLALLNQKAQAGALPARSYKKGKGYLSADGVMKFRNAEFKAYKCDTLVCLEVERPRLDNGQCRDINLALKENWTSKGYDRSFLAKEVPNRDDLSFIVDSAKIAVATYKCTFDLNRPLGELRQKYDLMLQAMKDGRLKIRTESGESFIDDDGIIKFRLIAPEESHIEEPSVEAVLESIETDKTTMLQELVAEVEQETEPETIYISDAVATEDKKKIVRYGNLSWQKEITIGSRTSVVKYTQEIVNALGDCKCILMVDKKALNINVPESMKIEGVDKLNKEFSAFNKLKN